MHRCPWKSLPRLFDRPTYRKRDVIERLFSWLEEYRWIATRFEKLTSSFEVMISLACLRSCLRKAFLNRLQKIQIHFKSRSLYKWHIDNEKVIDF
jgi:hypothetical protein